MSIATKNPPIRIRRATVTPIKAGTPKPPPPDPAPQAKPPKVVQASKAVVEKPKGPARTPPKPRPPLVKVENPRRVRKGSKEHRKLGGFVIASPAWGSPFRVREADGRWFVVWTGDEMRLAEFKPDGWKNIPCENRIEAAQLALEAFRDWITSPTSSDLLDHARAILRGYNLVCFCPHDYPCHGDILIELVNR